MIFNHKEDSTLNLYQQPSYELHRQSFQQPAQHSYRDSYKHSYQHLYQHSHRYLSNHSTWLSPPLFILLLILSFCLMTLLLPSRTSAYVILYPAVNTYTYTDVISGYFYLGNIANTTAEIAVHPHNFSQAFKLNPVHFMISPHGKARVNFTLDISSISQQLYPGLNHLGIDASIISSKTSGATINTMIILTYLIKIIKPVSDKAIALKEQTKSLYKNQQSDFKLSVQNIGKKVIHKINGTMTINNLTFKSTSVSNLNQGEIKTINFPVLLSYKTGTYNAVLLLNYDNHTVKKITTVTVLNNPFEIHDFYNSLENKSNLTITYYLKNNVGSPLDINITTSCENSENSFLTTLQPNSNEFIKYSMKLKRNITKESPMTCNLHLSSKLSTQSLKFKVNSSIFTTPSNYKNLKNNNSNSKSKSKNINISSLISILILLLITLSLMIFILLKRKRTSLERKEK